MKYYKTVSNTKIVKNIKYPIQYNDKSCKQDVKTSYKCKLCKHVSINIWYNFIMNIKYDNDVYNTWLSHDLVSAIYSTTNA